MSDASTVYTEAQEKADERARIRQKAVECASFVEKHLLSSARKTVNEQLDSMARNCNPLDPKVQHDMLRLQGSRFMLEELTSILSRLQK
jgi:hypothetical protein